MITWTWKHALAGLSVLTALVFTLRRARAAASKSHAKWPSDPSDIAVTPWWIDDDFLTLEQVARDIRANPADLLLVLAGESGLKPFAKAPTGAVGLNQLTPAANSTAGISEDQRQMIPELSVSAQLPIVGRFFSNIPWTKAGNSYENTCMLWEANFSPGYMTSRGTSLDTKLYDAVENPDAYKGNKGLDKEGKGYITVGDLCDQLHSVAGHEVYQSALRRLNNVTGQYYAPRFL
jgi:hypothetical protein